MHSLSHGEWEETPGRRGERGEGGEVLQAFDKREDFFPSASQHKERRDSLGRNGHGTRGDSPRQILAHFLRYPLPECRCL
jgi:hypothetical protein